MIISDVEILPNQEIKVPFDQYTELPGYIDCVYGSKTGQFLN